MNVRRLGIQFSMSEVVDALEIDPAVVKVATEVLSGKLFFFYFFHRFILEYTPPKFNSSPLKKGRLENDFRADFQGGTVTFRGCAGWK